MAGNDCLKNLVELVEHFNILYYIQNRRQMNYLYPDISSV